jgi:hypothetical protein
LARAGDAAQKGEMANVLSFQLDALRQVGYRELAAERTARLPNNEAAWREATLTTGELSKEIDGKFRLGQNWGLE